MKHPLNISIRETEDGSSTLIREDLDETYHSSKGAYTESMHVFIHAGLQYYEEKVNPTERPRVLEVGFGTGLNALLSWEYSKRNKLGVWYESLEPYPISPALTKELNYPDQLPDPIEARGFFDEIHTSPWGEELHLSPTFTLLKQTAKLEEFKGQDNLYDIIFFDAFAPQKQGELWEVEPLAKCFELLKPQGVLTTYCAQGQFKRNLKQVGFQVERLAGPPNGKREITRATK